MRKSNGVICLADADFCLRKTDNPYDDDDNNNNNQDDYKKGYIWTGGSSTSKERSESSIPPTPIHFYLLYCLNWNWVQHPYLSLTSGVD